MLIEYKLHLDIENAKCINTLNAFEENSFENRTIGLVVRLKNDRNGHGFAPKWAWLLKILHALRMQEYTRTSPLQILDPPLMR